MGDSPSLAERLRADAEWHKGECVETHGSAEWAGRPGCCADANAYHWLLAAADIVLLRREVAALRSKRSELRGEWWVDRWKETT